MTILSSNLEKVIEILPKMCDENPLTDSRSAIGSAKIGLDSKNQFWIQKQLQMRQIGSQSFVHTGNEFSVQ